MQSSSCVFRCVISMIRYQIGWVVVHGAGVVNKGTVLAEVCVLVIVTWVTLGSVEVRMVGPLRVLTVCPGPTGL